jgi:hypothetical protein
MRSHDDWDLIDAGQSAGIKFTPFEKCRKFVKNESWD